MTFAQKLRALSRLSVDDLGLDDPAALAKFVENESDRGAVIMLAATLEDFLEEAACERLPGLKGNPNLRSSLFDGDGPLATFSAKIRVAEALGHLTRDDARRVDALRHMRNACAHGRIDISFATPELRLACAEVMPREHVELARHCLPNVSSDMARSIFSATVMLLALSYVMPSAKELEGRLASLFAEIMRRLTQAAQSESGTSPPKTAQNRPKKT